MKLPTIFKQAFDSGDMDYSSYRKRLQQNRAWTNRDRRYIDNTIDDDATNIEFAIDQDNDDIALESPMSFKNKGDLLLYLDKNYEANRGSRGTATWDYAPKEKDRKYVDEVLGRGDRGAKRQIKYDATQKAILPAGIGALLGGIIPAVASKKTGPKASLLGATLGGLGAFSVAEPIIRRKLTKDRITNMPKNYDEYMASLPKSASLPVVLLKDSGYKGIEDRRKKGKIKPKSFMHGTTGQHNQGQISKTAIHVNDLPKIYEKLNIYRHKYRAIPALISALKNGTRIPKSVTPKKVFYETGGYLSVPFGADKGIHTTNRGGPIYYLQNFLKKKTPKTPEGKKVFNQLIMAHEGIESSQAHKVVPKFIRKNYDTFVTKMYNQEGRRMFLPKNRLIKYERNPQSKQFIDAMRGFTNRSYSSHNTPDVLLQESNILATLKGPGAKEGKSALRHVRHVTFEDKAIEDAAKKLGYKDFKYGKYRINRRERKALGDMMAQNSYNALDYIN